MGAHFPMRGVLPAIGILVLSALTIWIGVGQLHLDPGKLAVFTLFATWFAFVISTAEGWPIAKASRAWRGFIFVIVCLLYGAFHMWAQPRLLGFSDTYYWPVIANLFLAIGITIAFDNKLVAGLKQPIAVIMNILFWYLFAYLIIYIVPGNNGMVPAIWFAWFLFIFFWLERWPIANQPQPAKGILSFCMMVGSAVLLNYVFVWFFHSSFFQPDANSWFACWVFWLVMTSWVFDTWPVQALKQPGKGLVGLVLTVALASTTYVVLRFAIGIELANLGSYVWVFICWGYIWAICLAKWPATEEPALAPVPAPTAATEAITEQGATMA